MRLLAAVGSSSGPLRLQSRFHAQVGWLRNLGLAELALILLAVVALLAQTLCLYYEINRRTIRSTAGIMIDRDLVITSASDAAQRIGIQEGDRILKLNGEPVSNVLGYRRVLDRSAVGSMLALTVLREGEMIDLPSVAVERMPLDISIPLRHLAGLAFLVVGVVVAVLSPKERAARLFSLASLLLGLYVALMHSRVTGLIYLETAALALAPAAIIHFFLSFPQERALARSRWALLLYLPSLVLMILTIWAYNDALQAGMGFYYAPLYSRLTNEIGFTYLELSGVLGLVVMGHVYATTSQPIQRRQLQWIILGLFCAVVAAAVDLALTLSREQSAQAFRWLLLGFLPVPITFAFAILRYRLWDLDLVINRSVVYGLVTATLAAVYLLLISGLSSALGIVAGGREYSVLLFVSALLIGLLVNPLRARTQAAIDRIFFRQQVDHQAALARWSEGLNTSLRFADLARLLLEEVPEQLQIDLAWLLVLDEGERCLVSLEPEVEGAGAEEKQDPAGPLQGLVSPVHSAWALQLSRPGTVLLLDKEGRGSSAAEESSPGACRGELPGQLDEEGRAVVAEWEQAGVGLALPLISGTGQGAGLEGTGLVGIYLLGHKLSGDVYQRQEMEFLRTLSNQAAIAIANARLYEQVTGFSQELELKVQERTKELRDFVSAVYHELSTPITSIRGYTDVLLEREGAHLTSRQIHYLNTVRRNVGRLMRLVGDLSDVSRIDDERLTIHPEVLDLRQVVSETVGSLAGVIEEKGLQVAISIPPDADKVQGDRHRVVQILSNLVTNACRYTPAGGKITIAAESTRLDASLAEAGGGELGAEVEGHGHPDGGVRGTRRPKSTPLVELTVADTGIGIDKDDLEHIFERFYRSQAPLVQEQSGTGLGLAITKSLVELHGSRLWVDSTVGKGSTFGFALPGLGAPLGSQVEASALFTEYPAGEKHPAGEVVDGYGA